MSRWKCEICNSSFENFDARGFDNKIYCPLCYYKKLYTDTELERERLNKELEKYKYSADELNEIERLNNIIKESIKLTSKVNEMESARDLYDLVVDIKNKLKDSEKNES